jgi:hypothetical protein
MPNWSIMFWRSCWVVMMTGGAANAAPHKNRPMASVRIFFIRPILCDACIGHHLSETVTLPARQI